MLASTSVLRCSAASDAAGGAQLDASRCGSGCRSASEMEAPPRRTWLPDCCRSEARLSASCCSSDSQYSLRGSTGASLPVGSGPL
jgi:hypothetical protein